MFFALKAGSAACSCLPRPSLQVCSLGRRLGGLLVDLQYCQAHCPRLVAALRAVVAGEQARVCSHVDRSFDAISGA